MKNTAYLNILLENVNKKIGARLLYAHTPGTAKPHKVYLENTARCPIRLDCDFYDIAEVYAYLAGLQRGFVTCEIKRELEKLVNDFKTK